MSDILDTLNQLDALIDSTATSPSFDRQCAWCLQEQGVKPSSEDSHGICAHHASQTYQRYQNSSRRPRRASA